MNTTRYCPKCGEECSWDDRFCQHCRAELGTPKGQRDQTPGLAQSNFAQTELGLPSGSLLLNRYRIQRQLGMGGMGRVYLATDEKLAIPVAIKVLREVLSRDPSSVKRLIAEAKHSIILSHPNVVRIHNFEDGEMAKFLVMEYVEGETLADRIINEGKLSEQETRRIAIEICKGLEHAHEQKVIHRDIKPGNILIRKDGAIKIADFGIARECRDSVSRLTSQVDSGTLLYMSPEQLIGKSNEASDVYSLGIMFYEMLTGEPPFRSGDVTYQIREVLPVPPQGISPGMTAIVMMCLGKKPEHRFGSVRKLREELDGTAERRHQEEERQAADKRRMEEEKQLADEKRLTEETRRREEQERKLAEERRREELELKRRQEEVKTATADLLATASELLGRGDFDQAEAKLQEALRMDPDNAEAASRLRDCRAQKAATDERSKYHPPAAAVISEELPTRRANEQEQRRKRQIRLPLIGLSAVVILVALGIWYWTRISSSPTNPPGNTGSTEGMAFIGGGGIWIMMGSVEPSDFAKPVHKVSVDPFFIDKYEVTNRQYGEFMKATQHEKPAYWEDSRFNAPDQPVVGMSWYDAVAYCACAGKRLPTEAEWETAARGGLEGKKYPWGDDGPEGRAAYGMDSNVGKPATVGTFKPNGYGLFDMAGNVWEWCADRFDENYYRKSPDRNPQGPLWGKERTVRGGSWSLNDAFYVNTTITCAVRNGCDPSAKHFVIGFRCARTP
ncbi:MAG: SUMF1/EgtB/PvdO family nonheme iron enzyme [Acidobacteriota bacterium]